ncbi:hypothetical protein Pmar_PMAR028487 [Perkinsus marinus ATCC 50983]|uniref:K Homology domain-containing protein n=1 Tax=Perkinsus marinus (strain ATCC 50983 / TXsc) TaxID=423536 RepID=C5LM96_PERM5|nr:hypothetical protein Pmar_PMAR028487 [Perkinsus marinus ATCC 50983]EER02108.1 hypothetical protein Pmar_PMAR028487 [Perkinsus marinus ATCC 50983]|eukprot:XP_002769390.1 hypothetical protein Pmar_PMAR028487 [Perkinsus marinus ATCC 50983]
MDSSGMAASDGTSTGVKRGLDQSSASGGDEAPSLPPEKKPAIAELVAKAAAAAAAAAAARVTSSAQQQGVILQPQTSQSPAQQGPLGRPPMPTTPPARLDITPGGENSASKFYGAIIASSLPEEFVREVKCPHSVMGRIIGPRGATINQLQSTTLCKIQCQPGQPGGFARVKISGPTQTCVDGAVTYVQAMVGNWDDYTDEQLMQAGGKEIRKEIPLPYIHVGSVIGPKGSVIKTIEADTGAKLQVGKSV